MHKHKTIVPQNKENKNIFVDSTEKSSEAVFRISSPFAKNEPHCRDDARKNRLTDSNQRAAKIENKKSARRAPVNFARMIPDCTATKNPPVILKCSGDFFPREKNYFGRARGTGICGRAVILERIGKGVCQAVSGSGRGKNPRIRPFFRIFIDGKREIVHNLR
jgi:hypothetical protein